MPGPDERKGVGKRSFKGLPPLEEPFVKPGHRVLLMACSKTGRASWADLAPLAKHDGGFRWVGHIPAIPDFAAIKGGTKAGSGRGRPAIPARVLFQTSPYTGATTVVAFASVVRPPYRATSTVYSGSAHLAGRSTAPAVSNRPAKTPGTSRVPAAVACSY